MCVTRGVSGDPHGDACITYVYIRILHGFVGPCQLLVRVFLVFCEGSMVRELHAYKMHGFNDLLSMFARVRVRVRLGVFSRW